ncbi:MAG: flagellar filament capping protein FliD [Burkholderiales bacterium]
MSASSTGLTSTSAALASAGASLSGTGISSPGIGSGLNVNGIVSSLMAVESQPLNLLNQQEASYQAKLSAYGSLTAGLSSFQSSVATLTSQSTFQSLSATPSDSTVLTATAANSASTGNYSIDTTALAQAQTLVATGQTSTTSAIGTGASTTLTFSFGTTTGTTTKGVYGSGTTFVQDPTQGTKTVTIDNTNNSLQGIADAINAANIGITASIVNDGSSTPYRLELTSSTGASHSMEIAVSGDTTLTSLLNYNPTQAAGSGQNMTQTVSGQDAALTVNGLSITSPTNTVSSAISGVTLNLLKIGTSSLSVTNDASSVATTVQSFVTAYNTLHGTLSSLTAYDSTTKQGGPLLGDYTAMSVQTKLTGVLVSAVPGLSSSSSSITTLGQLGISLNKDGTLSLDNTKLQSAISSNLSDIAGMFASVGKTTDSLVNYVSSTSNTQPGSYSVNVSQLATQGNLLGNINLNSGLTITKGSNDTLSLTLDGITSTETLAAGTYNSSQLATLVQSAINGDTAFSSAGSSVAVSIDPTTGFMTITSNRYGSASSVTVANTSAGAALMGSSNATTGVDVAGTIDGISATGSGQNLTGLAGTATDGLTIKIAGGSLGSRGTINYSQGYATGLDNAITGILSNSGQIASATNGINSNITDLKNQITAMNTHLSQVQKNYLNQFTSLDVLMGTMQSTSSYLTQQLANLPKVN